MTEPTQAQIETALNTFNHCMEKGQNRRQAITAALTGSDDTKHIEICDLLRQILKEVTRRNAT
jgi:hypothetical protein